HEMHQTETKPAPRRRGITQFIHPSGFHDAFNRGFDQLRNTYEEFLGWALAHRKLTVVAMLGFALGSIVLYPFIGRDFFPAVDAGQFRLHVRAPAGTRIEETERIFGQVEDVIRSVVPESERALILDNMGLTQSFTVMAYIDNGTVSEADGEILVALKPEHAPTAHYVEALRNELNHKFPNCTIYFEPADITSQILNFGLPAPIDVQVVGVNRAENAKVANKLRQQLATIPGIADVHLHQMMDEPNIRFDVDRVMGSELGLTQQDVTGSMLVSLSSTNQVAPNYWVNPANHVSYRVAVQTPQYRLHSLETVLNTPIAGSTPDTRTQLVDGETLRQPPQMFGNLAKMERTLSQANVNHYNTQPVYEVMCNTQGRDLAAVAGDVQRVVDSIQPELPKGSFVAVRGQVETMNNSFIGLGTGLLFAVLLVYLLMVVNFQSWLDPFIILMALPGALAGILWMLFVTQTTFSVPALMGAIMCIGVATSNSILMVTFANQRRHEGDHAIAAALSAGTTRLRPILMTALAMVIGMLPMSLGLGEGGEQNAPLGRAVIGGLLMATAFTLFFVPVMYTILRRKKPIDRSAMHNDEDNYEPDSHDGQISFGGMLGHHT
ncbi:MAG TPA: efflux RND transporter permease subunit, partial [Lacipirellulaceae bacterium]|nr:efflux RND transporter permease subunit [Lacipirellulaceae bacterium]